MYSEKQLIGMIRQRFSTVQVPVGLGDDAAVVDLPVGFSTVLCADLLVEETHFRRSTHPADSIGFKAIAINVSDVGAMGGIPAYSLISLAVPPDLETTWIEGFFDGVEKACEDFQIQLVGGDSSVAERIFVDVSMVGRVRQGGAVRRSGASPGDGVYVTGSLGGAARGLELLGTEDPTHRAVRRHLYPEPRHVLAQEVAPKATAMIDVSDGFSVDLAHILDASNVSARIERDQIPCDPDADVELALHGGEDYELIITGREFPDRIGEVPITRVGEIVESSDSHQIWLCTGSHEEILEPAGWQHFR